MSQKSGKPPRRNPFLGENRDKLLDELNSIQDLLGEAADDVEHTPLDDAIPVLGEDQDEETADTAKGDADNQIPLLTPDGEEEPARPANDRLRRALSERENPFLAGARRAAAEKAAAAARHESPPPPEKPTPPPADEPPAEPPLSDQDMRAIVDEVLAAWLPKIERELRDRLMDYLRSR